MALPALFDKANGILIVLPDNAELTSEVSSYDNKGDVRKMIDNLISAWVVLLILLGATEQYLLVRK
jgi:hypothetical protein